jgi:hypothetical protein
VQAAIRVFREGGFSGRGREVEASVARCLRTPLRPAKT